MTIYLGGTPAQSQDLLTLRESLGKIGLVTDSGPRTSSDITIDKRNVNQYSLYQPTITRLTIIDGTTDPTYSYNHDSATRFFKGYFFAFWNASSTGSEGGTPQYILMKKSLTFEGLATAPAVQCFSDSAYTNNPIDASAGQQWQPGLFVTDDELWVVWNQSGGNAGVYFSKLTDPLGKFTTTLQTLTPLVRNGVTYDEASTTGDIVEVTKADGSFRRLMPIVYHSSTTSIETAPSGVSSSQFTRSYKLAGCLTYDEGDTAWKIGGLVTDVAKPWCPWEPFFSLQPDGAVRLFVRSLDTSAAKSAFLLTAISHNAGMSFTRLEQSGVPVASSRGTVAVRTDGGPSVMIANDNVGTSTGASSADWRRNLALYCGNGAHDFVPGLALTDDALDRIPSYPSAFIYNNKLYITYSCLENAPNGAPSKVKGLIVDPAPPRTAIMPRKNARTYRSPYFLTTGYAHFAYRAHSRLSTVANMTALSATVQSVVIIAEPTDIGVLFDNRKSNGGWLLQIKNGRLWAGVVDDSGVFHDIDSTLTKGSAGATFGAKLDTTTGDIVFWTIKADGTFSTNTVALSFTIGGALNQSTVAYLGCANLSSSLSAITGRVRCIKIWGSALTDNNLRSLHNTHATATGMTTVAGATTAPSTPDFDFDASDSHAGTNDSTWLANFTATDQSDGIIVSTTRSSRPVIQIKGSASAGLSPNSTGYLNTHYSVEYETTAVRTQEAAILTCGDAINNILIAKTIAGDIVAHQTTDGVLRTDTTITTGAPDAVPIFLNVMYLGDRLVITHNGDVKVFPFKGRPIVILGDAWNPRASKSDNDVYIYTDTLGAKNAAIAEPAYAHPLDIRRESDTLVLTNTLAGSVKIAGLTTASDGKVGVNQTAPQYPLHITTASSPGVVLDGYSSPEIRLLSNGTGTFHGGILGLYAGQISSGIMKGVSITSNNGSAGVSVFSVDRRKADYTTAGSIMTYDDSTGEWQLRSAATSSATTTTTLVKSKLDRTEVKRLSQRLGTALTAADFTVGGGFGTGATLAVVGGTDGAYTISVTCGATGLVANPGITHTLKDGTNTQTPIVVATSWNETDLTAQGVKGSADATHVYLKFLGTPLASKVYYFSVIVGW